MPYIDARITKKLTPREKEELVAEFGRAISVVNKPKNFLMTEISDGREIYFGGRKLINGAYVALDVCGDQNPPGSGDFTARVCEILEKFGIPANSVYVEYRHTPDWGFNGKNF